MDSTTINAKSAIVGVRSPAHVPALDAVRGLSMLMVAIYHKTFLKPDNVLAEIFVFAAGGLSMTVNIFFALSSFLITGILVGSEAIGNEADVRTSRGRALI